MSPLLAEIDAPVPSIIMIGTAAAGIVLGFFLYENIDIKEELLKDKEANESEGEE